MKRLRSQLSEELEAGTDEAGRGCLAGPVTAAAVILPKNFDLPYLNDSKKLTKTQRFKLRQMIENQALTYAVANVFQDEIKNPYCTTPNNPSGLLNSGPTRNAGEIVLVGWHQCKIDPCFLIDAAYDDGGTKKSLDPMLQVPTGF